MIVNVANPIYDSVFKFLMEDNRIARTLLSLLLRKNVLEVEMRPHEYSNINRNDISMFRIDFGAKVRESDGTVRLVLVELQKTWVETETLRFRQYLGAHYSNPENMMKDDAREGMVGEERSGAYAIPMVTIYLLGHKVGDIEEPVVYVNHDVVDYYNHPVTKGIPDPFVNSLVHDSVIVQIPRLRGQVSNRLDLLLSFFDQTQKDGQDRHMLSIDEDKYKGEPEMEHILHRLLVAASNHEMRMKMNVEDEYFKAIEDRDTALMNRDKKIKEKEEELSRMDEQLSQKDEQLSQKDEQLSQKDEQLSQKDEQLSQKDEQLSQKDEQLSQKDEIISQQKSVIQRVAQTLRESGKTMDEIALIMNLPVEDIERIYAQ